MRRICLLQFLLILIVAAAPVSRAGGRPSIPFLAPPSAQGEGDAASREAAAAVRGEQIYRSACEACHGATGEGDGPGAEPLNPKPRDFTKGVYKFRSTPAGTLPTDEDLFRTIYQGVPRTMMPAWKDLLSEREIRDLVAYIKTFSDQFQQWGPGEPISIPEEPEMTEATIAEGRNVYMILECWSCHGPEGRGDGPSAGDLTDDWGEPIRPFDFTVGEYKAGNTDADIYKTLNTGLSGTPMPNYAENFLFPREAFEDLSNMEEVYSPEELAALKKYGEQQPTDEELENMSEEEQEALANRRRWALVHYLKSLSRKKGLFYKLFIENTEETK